MDEIKRRATVHDVAREAGVSLATVDRVLNGRPGVRSETASKVAEAIRTLDFRRDLSASLLARARDLGVTFLIPDGRNEFMFALGAAIQRRAIPDGVESGRRRAGMAWSCPENRSPMQIAYSINSVELVYSKSLLTISFFLFGP